MKSLGYVADISIGHGAGVGSMDYNILRIMFKNI